MYAECSCKISHVVFEARLENVVAPRTIGPVSLPGIAADTVKAHHPYSLCQLGILCRQHAAFPRADVFRGIEAETSHVTKGAYLAAKVGGSESVCGVFNHSHAEFAGTGVNPVHV